MFHKVKANKILFLGNSITLHGPAPAIGWLGNWGMAASTKDNDYVHLVLKAISQTAGKEPQSIVANIADFEGNSKATTLIPGLRKSLPSSRISSWWRSEKTCPLWPRSNAKAAFQASTAKLLKKLKQNSDPVIVVRSCFWPDQAKDSMLKQACADVGGIFVDAGALGKDEANFARSERQFSHAGVAAHPGDKGMRAIADAILNALRNGGK